MAPPLGERERPENESSEKSPGYAKKTTTTITYRSFPSTRYRPRDHLCRGRVPLGLYILRLEVPARSCSSSALFFFFFLLLLKSNNNQASTNCNKNKQKARKQDNNKKNQKCCQRDWCLWVFSLLIRIGKFLFDFIY